MASSSEYSASGIQPPTVQSLRESAARTGLTLSDQQLQQYAEVIAGFIPDYTLTASLPEPTLPVKYPRTPGYRPPPQENTHNAWFWKTDISGAPGGVLQGKRVAIKDNIAVAGVPMMNGSRIMEGYIPEFDATVVSRILDAGGHISGKATCENLCFSGSSITSAKGPVTNPFDKTKIAGGSSSGSAVLVTLGEVDMALGGDQGGSIRIPASWCGVVGLKPSYGLVPYTGAMSLDPSIDHLGPMAKNVKNVAFLLEAIAGPDNFDFRQPDSLKIPKYTEKLDGKIEGLKIGFLQEGFERCDSSVCELVKNVQTVLETMNLVTVDWTSIPEHFQATTVATPLYMEGLFNGGIRGEGNGMGWRGFYPSSMCEHARRGFKTMANDISEHLKLGMLTGDYIKTNYGNQFYNKSQNLRPGFTKIYNDALEKCDVLFMPTLPCLPKKIPAKESTIKEVLGHIGEISNVTPFNYTGHPALSLNVGYIEGMPVGGMLVGKMFDEETVLRVAYALEQALQE